MAGQTFAWATLMAMGVVTAFGAIENAISRLPSGNEADTAKRRQKGAGDDREAFSCLIELN